MLLFVSLMTLGMASWLPTTLASGNTTTLGISKNFSLFSWPLSSSIKGMMEADQSFSFHLDKSAVLQLIDYKQPGDVFQLFDNGHSLGKTIRSQNINEKDKVFAETPEDALKDIHHRFSKGQALLSPGDHFITIKVLKGASTNLSGGGIRLIEAPLKLQQLYKNKHIKDDEYLSDDDEYLPDDDVYLPGDAEYIPDDNEIIPEEEEEDDDEYHHDDFDYTMTLTVVVPPVTPDLWRHRTEPIVTMMPAPVGNRARGGVLPVAAQLRGGLEAITFIPPAGRALRNPMAGGGRR